MNAGAHIPRLLRVMGADILTELHFAQTNPRGYRRCFTWVWKVSEDWKWRQTKTKMSVHRMICQSSAHFHCQGLEETVVFAGNSVDLDEFTIRVVDGD